MLESIRAVFAGETTAEALAREALARLEKENPRANAVVECRPETVLEQARRIDGRVQSGKAGRLAGAIVTVKDNLEAAGLHATAGLARFKDSVAETDCGAVAKLRAADALILGKTNLPPGAMDAQTDNPVYGRTNHPLFPDRSCGGSCGGGACAVRLGLCHADLGNDLMGSVRIPAHFCGTYGFVPTGGAILLDGFVGGKAPGSTLSHMLRPGLLTADPRDARLLLAVLLESRFPLREAPLPKRLKIAWSLDCGGLPLSQDSRAVLEAFLQSLEADNDLYELKDGDYPFVQARESFLRLL
ncbi:MAG TPA: amidase family protein, partial [Clostridia bacterium]|nr:amidase family protein [Clostridia bacterium]